MATGVVRVAYRIWSVLPEPVQHLLLFLGAAKVTLGVAALVRDAEGRLLIVHHTYRHPAWGFPGGLVKRTEQPFDALARELREELGVTSEIGAIRHAANEPVQRHLTMYYDATIRGIPRHHAETDNHRYVAVKDLPSYLGKPFPVWLYSLAREAPADQQ